MKLAIPKITMSCLIATFAAASPAIAADEPWLPSLITATPQEGFALAVKLSRVGVKTTRSMRKTATL